MPHLVVHWCTDSMDGNTILLGICEYTKRPEMEEKVKHLCAAMEWDYKDVTWTHCYDNKLIFKGY